MRKEKPMINEIYIFSFWIISGILNVFLLLGIAVLILKIIQTIQEVYHNFKFDKMIKRTDKDIDRLVKKKLNDVSVALDDEPGNITGKAIDERWGK